MELLDSLQILRMVADVETRFSIQVGNDDLTPRTSVGGEACRLCDTEAARTARRLLVTPRRWCKPMMFRAEASARDKTPGPVAVAGAGAAGMAAALAAARAGQPSI